jgi:hypothetical protein
MAEDMTNFFVNTMPGFARKGPGEITDIFRADQLKGSLYDA